MHHDRHTRINTSFIHNKPIIDKMLFSESLSESQFVTDSASSFWFHSYIEFLVHIYTFNVAAWSDAQLRLCVSLILTKIY